MNILLIGEASGVHKNLKKGLLELGHSALHMILHRSQQGRTNDGSFSPEIDGLLGGISRNIYPLVKSLTLDNFDVINYLNTITAVSGKHTKYLDIPIIRKKTNLLSYYAVGCDELGLIRRSTHNFQYSPCATCIKSGELLGKDCENHLNPRYEKSVDTVKKYFDVAGCAMIEYDHTSLAFDENKFKRIPLPIDIKNISFAPAKNRKKIKIAHTPTRRGFKGSAIVIEAIELLKNKRNDFEFITIEGKSYSEYLKIISDIDIVIDQVYSQSPGMNALEMIGAGKIVLTGATETGKSYFDFMEDFPGINASPMPSILAEDISQAIDNRSNFSELSEKGRSYIEKNHSCSYSASKFLELWNDNLQTKKTLSPK